MNTAVTVLHVEDSKHDRDIFAQLWMLCYPHSILRSVDSAITAIEYLKGEEVYCNRDSYPFPDFIVSDVNMPDMSGEEFLQWRNSSEFRALPVAVLTGSVNETVINRLTTLGAVMVLSKGY